MTITLTKDNIKKIGSFLLFFIYNNEDGVEYLSICKKNKEKFESTIKYYVGHTFEVTVM